MPKKRKEANEITDTIRVYERDKERIASEGNFNESWPEVVRRILDERDELKNKLEKRTERNPLMALTSCEPIPA